MEWTLVPLVAAPTILGARMGLAFPTPAAPAGAQTSGSASDRSTPFLIHIAIPDLDSIAIPFFLPLAPQTSGQAGMLGH